MIRVGLKTGTFRTTHTGPEVMLSRTEPQCYLPKTDKTSKQTKDLVLLVILMTIQFVLFKITRLTENNKLKM